MQPYEWGTDYVHAVTRDSLGGEQATIAWRIDGSDREVRGLYFKRTLWQSGEWPDDADAVLIVSEADLTVTDMNDGDPPPWASIELDMWNGHPLDHPEYLYIKWQFGGARSTWATSDGGRTID